ncbi:molybdate ABC transporter substrate-binding protein [Agarivorans sp. MS3-6]|uniref:molybdate ABC transporter substrate-binding protein n=1 Tax=Agarivorans sp. TSD2052 TaxID=2937286 RepID=UPI0020109337|nr:molybdate ABC transporter substrate-binding protein [Agarivorans sp. TSD2052]UPW20417.1 molybdate ABC transporter substrate-binding protein [Agarivorans sp. TSD2052]
MVKLLVTVLLMVMANIVNAAPVTMAVAANFKATLELLAKDYQAVNSNFVYRISSASTGVLYNQVLHGAPFDLFFSADEQRAKLLFTNQYALAQKPYAVGQLVFWAPNYTNAYGQPVMGEQLWREWQFGVAYANPKLAPYGLAADQLVKQKGLTSKLILANNVSQVYQFIVTGNVAGGFVARSTHALFDGSYWLVPTHFHQRLAQHVALLEDTPQALGFYQYLSSAKAQTIITDNGYLLP